MRCDVEQVQHAGELADVPAGDRHRGRTLEEALDLVAVASDGRSLLGAPGVVELQLELGHAFQVLLVQESYDGQGVGQRPLAQPGSRIGVARDLVRRTERVVELHQVELTQLGQGDLVLTLGMGVLAVLLVHREPARVQGEVHGPEPHGLAQLRVVGLAVLPARGHGGHHRLGIEVPEGTGAVALAAGDPAA